MVHSFLIVVIVFLAVVVVVVVVVVHFFSQVGVVEVEVTDSELIEFNLKNHNFGAIYTGNQENLSLCPPRTQCTGSLVYLEFSENQFLVPSSLDTHF